MALAVTSKSTHFMYFFASEELAFPSWFTTGKENLPPGEMKKRETKRNVRIITSMYIMR